jgi:hypothetical protein
MRCDAVCAAPPGSVHPTRTVNSSPAYPSSLIGGAKTARTLPTTGCAVTRTATAWSRTACARAPPMADTRGMSRISSTTAVHRDAVSHRSEHRRRVLRRGKNAVRHRSGTDPGRVGPVAIPRPRAPAGQSDAASCARPPVPAHREPPVPTGAPTPRGVGGRPRPRRRGRGPARRPAQRVGDRTRLVRDGVTSWPTPCR